MSPQVLTGIFTLSGVALTATAALIAALLKYRLDRAMVARNDLREALARAISKGQELEDLFIAAHENREDRTQAKEIKTQLDSAFREVNVTFSEVSLLAASSVRWYPYFNALHNIYREKEYLRPGYADTHLQTLQPLYDRFMYTARKELN